MDFYNIPSKKLPEGTQFYYGISIITIAIAEDIWEEDVDSIWYMEQLTSQEPYAIHIYKEKREYINKYKLFHEVYGMSTKRVQRMRGNEELKTSEGTQHFTPILYTLKQWSENMESYLRSAMSYASCFTLNQFKTEVDLIVNSNNAVNSVNK